MAIGGSSNDIEITVKVDDQGAVSTFDNLGNKIEQVSKTASSSGSAFDSLGKTFLYLNQGVELVSKAFGILQSAASAGVDAIKRGSEVDDITVSFQNLASQAGVAGDELLNTLGNALGNTTPKLDQMKQANELLLGGIDPSKFELLAKAARSIGEATGQSAAEGMNQLSDSLLRGNDRALKTLGIVVDNEKAIRDFEKANGLLTGTLSEQGKVIALREASLKALEQAQGKLGDVTDDAADKLDQLSSAMTNAKDEMFKALANNKELNDALGNLVDVVKQVDFSAFAEGLSKIIALAINAASAIAQIGVAIAESFDTRSIAQKAFDQTAASVEKVTKQLDGLREAIHSVSDQGQLEQLKGRFEGLQEQIAKLADKNQKKALEGLFLTLNDEAISRWKELPKAISKAKEGLVDHTAAEKAAAEAAKKHRDAIDQITSSIRKATGVDAFPALTKEIQDAFARESVVGADGVAEAIEKIATSALAAKVPLEEIKSRIEEIGKAPIFGPGNAAGEAEFAQQMEDKAQQLRDFGDSISADLASTLGDVLTDGINGGLNSDSIKATIQNLGSSIGSDLGLAIGGPFGAAFGQAIGALAGKQLSNITDIFKGGKGSKKGTAALIDSIFPGIGTGLSSVFGSIFGSESAGTTARKAADKFFSDAFDAQRLAVIINGQLKEINSLVFQGDTLFGGNVDFKSGTAFNFLQSLPAEAQAAFSGVGTAFEQLLGVSNDISGQIGAVLANNIGGSLNNLQLLVQASGVSFDQLHDSVVNAFLDGKLSALEAAGALQAVANISQQGIPDGIGLVTQAFDNLAAAGVKGGRALVDALGDIGAEAKELGIKDFGTLRQYLINTGRSAEDVDKLLSSLTQNGITGVDQLTSATADQLIPVLASLQNLKFPFSEQANEANDEAQKLLDTVSNLPKEIRTRLIVDVETNDPANALDVLKQQTAGRSATLPRTLGRA